MNDRHQFDLDQFLNAAPVADITDHVPEKMPGTLRIQSISRSLSKDGLLIMTLATLFHEHASITVTWTSRQPDVNLQRNTLVKVRWAGRTRCDGGAIKIDRLVQIDRPDAATNLFETIPLNWMRDRGIVQRAIALWEALPRPLAALFNALMWNGDRFHRYVYGPSSLNGHHNTVNGNLTHSVEVAEAAVASGRCSRQCNLGLLRFGGLVHDAGKAAEYVYDRERQIYRMSERGQLIGHRDTLIDWLATARFSGRVIMPETLYLVMMHMLNSAKGAPYWLGLRQPRTLEAEILSAADRISADGNLFFRNAPADVEGGFGRYHKHLRGAPYALPVARQETFPDRVAANDSHAGMDDSAESNRKDERRQESTTPSAKSPIDLFLDGPL